MISILLGAIIFGYVVYVLWRVPKKQSAGKCASCELNKSYSSGCFCNHTNDAKTK